MHTDVCLLCRACGLRLSSTYADSCSPPHSCTAAPDTLMHLNPFPSSALPPRLTRTCCGLRHFRPLCLHQTHFVVVQRCSYDSCSNYSSATTAGAAPVVVTQLLDNCLAFGVSIVSSSGLFAIPCSVRACVCV